MTYPYAFHPAAEAEHYEAITFYESRQAGLGAAYLKEFEQVIKRVLQDPFRYPVERKPHIHRISLHRFPFKILYLIAKDTVQILAVAHIRRRPDYWVNRIRNP